MSRDDPSARRVLDAVTQVPGGSHPPVVLIDGFSGAGKSTLADALVRLWPVAQLVRLEHFYPGWDGLDAASLAVHDDILVPFSTAGSPGWRRWDWTVDAAAEWHPVDAAAPLVIEGVGALSRANRSLASLGVWVELDSSERKRRALDRDGDSYRPHWERWARQERVYADRERPAELADFRIDGRGLTTMGR